MKQPQPVKVRAGRCGARCSCGSGRCDCDAYAESTRLSTRTWKICVCGHTQQVHELISLIEVE